ncbi:hypothetical protein NL676_011803 [Syzygium grande]|nr:hypothetical protein NL676_011803 [Syzygium grande]
MLLVSSPNQPRNSTQPTLGHLRNCRTPRDVDQIHARMITTGLIRDASLASELVLAAPCSSPDPPVAEFVPPAAAAPPSRAAAGAAAAAGGPFSLERDPQVLLPRS